MFQVMEVRELESCVRESRSVWSTLDSVQRCISAGVNAVSVKAFQEAFSSPAETLSTLIRVGDVGLVDVEPLALALTSLETDTAAARSSGLIESARKWFCVFLTSNSY
jgi:hypothetical protein